MQHKIATYEFSREQALTAGNGQQLAEHLAQEIKRMHNVITEIERGTYVMYRPSPEPTSGPVHVPYVFDDSVQVINNGPMPTIMVNSRYKVVDGNFFLSKPNEPYQE